MSDALFRLACGCVLHGVAPADPKDTARSFRCSEHRCWVPLIDVVVLAVKEPSR